MKLLKSPYVIIHLILVALYFVGRLTKTAAWFKVSSWSNYPALKEQEHFFVLSLVKSKRFDLICFYTNTPEWAK